MILTEIITEVEQAMVRALARSVQITPLAYEAIKVATLIEIHEELCRLRDLEK